MKIALIPGVFFPQPGGAQVQTHNLANKLVQMGYEVDVLILNKTNIKNNLYNIIVINKIVLSMLFYLNEIFKIDLSFFFKLYLKTILKKNNYDIFHFQLLNFKTLFILKIIKRLNKKVVVTFQGIDIQIDKNINYGYRLNKSYEKNFLEAIRKIDKFFSISKNIKNDLLDLGISENKINMIPNAVETDKFSQFRDTKDNINKKINLITVARFAKNKKGLDLIPKIAKVLKDKRIDFEWTIVGFNSKKIKDLKSMEEFKENFKYLNNIENLDENFFPHSNLINLYKKNHLYINLARIESFGITIVEALASGLPVITFDTKGGNELVKNDFNGTIVKDLSPDLMANAINSYYKNENYYQNHKKNTLPSINDFDLSLIAKQTIKSYSELI